ncbi:alpha-N-acetylgalactosaminide alpha-2,6-sialyltransferase 2-like [Protopterus annectens]|uniref:alpha-N-acetylgalactosaminide alpha-2,6-sialyltransferase 2-like n=1 Tax=Protopterus annectens TaxID=7888 RepID=UPI001CF98C53|nr:alpha-N-acetylgalactosaminide alpha-2,6-sialyltransferase 2-like [Protopterus annectens]
MSVFRTIRSQMKRKLCTTSILGAILLIASCILYSKITSSRYQRLVRYANEKPESQVTVHDQPQNNLAVVKALQTENQKVIPTQNKVKDKKEAEIKPTEPPVLLGEAYATDTTYMNSKCPERIREVALNIEWLKRIFIHTIPVLQWNDHVTMEEYQRLQIYNLCYGYAIIDFAELKRTLDVLNATANRFMFDDWEVRKSGQKPCIHCAVVGNGGILKDSKKGKEIDDHDYIFRVNGAITQGFENDVGNRTSFYFFSTNTMKNSLWGHKHAGFTGLPQSQETRYVFIPENLRDYLMIRAAATNTTVEFGKDKSSSPPDYFGKQPGPEKFKLLHPDFLRYMRNRFLKAGHWKSRIYRPSTGAIMLLTALHTCDKVSAYGFITPEYGNYSAYYYDRKYTKLIFYGNHHLKMEMNLWQRLHEAGAIKLYMKT